MPTPLPPIYDVFVLSGAGIIAANAAAAHGPLIDIASFKIGTGSGGATSADTGLTGTLVYSGTPTAWNRQADGTVDIVCVIPPTLNGSYQEVGLYLADGTMFARMVFSNAQTLFAGSLSRNSYTLHCLLKLEQGSGLITSSIAVQQPQVSYVDKWSNVTPPSTYPSDTRFLIVQEAVNIEGTFGILTPATTGDAWVVANAVSHDLLQFIFSDGASVIQTAFFSAAPYDSDYSSSPTRSQTVISWLGTDGKQHFRLCHSEPSNVDFRAHLTPTVAITSAIVPVSGSNVTVASWEQNVAVLQLTGAVTGTATIGGDRGIVMTTKSGIDTLGGFGSKYYFLDRNAATQDISVGTTYTNASNHPELLIVDGAAASGGIIYVNGPVQVGASVVNKDLAIAAGSAGTSGASGSLSVVLPPNYSVTIGGSAVQWLQAYVLS